MDSQGVHVMTIANSIIGVSILAMPYCFKQCGIILSIVMLVFSSVISRLACHFLLKSAIRARLRTFEFLAYHAFGALGKFIVEIGMIGFLLGTCIAFFVVMGDLGPQIVAQMVGISITSTLRMGVLIGLAVFFILPLGLLRNVDSLSGVCTAAIGFYLCLVLKIMSESAPHLLSGDWYNNVEYWRLEGVLQCLPIFSMALFCQTQLFEIYQAIPNASLEKMNNLIRVAVNICTSVYIFVGVFGYIALSSESFRGNILMSFKPSFMTEIMKIGFVLSVAFSFPLIIFPCRASLFSLLYKPTYTLHDGGTNYIPEGKFRLLTVLVVGISLVIGILIPNIELVLGLVGSTIGVMICVLFPATSFICMSKKNTNERILAQIMLFVGIIVMVLGTYANLYAMEEARLSMGTERVEIVSVEKIIKNNEDVIITTLKAAEIDIDNNQPKEIESHEVLKEVRHEPPQPVAPDVAAEGNLKEAPSDEVKVVDEVKITKNETVVKIAIEELPAKQNDAHTEIIINPEQVDIEAIKKEDKEIKQQEKDKQKDTLSLDLIGELQKQNEMQQQLVEEKKKVLEEIKQRQEALKSEQEHMEINKVQAVKQIESIAKQAIESLVGDDVKQPNDVNESKLNLAVPVRAFISPNDGNIIKPDSTKIPLADPSPLPYQLSHNEKNAASSNTSVQQPIKIDKAALESLVPLPIAKSRDLANFISNRNTNELIKPDDNPLMKETKIDKVEDVDKNANQMKLSGDGHKKDDIQVIRRDILSQDDSTRYKRSANNDEEMCDKHERNLKIKHVEKREVKVDDCDEAHQSDVLDFRTNAVGEEKNPDLLKQLMQTNLDGHKNERK